MQVKTRKKLKYIMFSPQVLPQEKNKGIMCQ